VESPESLCPACWKEVDFLAAPLCEACGTPFPFAIEEGALCGACLQDRPPWRRARAVLRYDDKSRRLILALKHADRADLAPSLARWMFRAGGELLDGADVIAPVPLHRFRLWRRRYNQAALLAQRLAKLSGKPAIMDLLARTRSTPSQGTLEKGARARNVRGAFAVRPRRQDLIQGKAVLLIDDVLTSGATAGECARALLAKGAASVDVLVAARVILPG
jgi:ComF family protein